MKLKNHPLQDIVLNAFNFQDKHDVISLMEYFAGCSITKNKHGKIDKSYERVIKDVLSVMEENNIIKKDENGWFYLKQ